MSTAQSAHPTESGNPPPERVLYLYCLAAAQLASAAPVIAGLSDLMLYRRGDLVAICGWTEVDQWSGPESDLNLQDLQWLGPRVMRHQAVIEAAMRAAAVLPARLGTLFSSPDALGRFLDVHQHTIAGFLRQTADHEEWAVKGLLDRTRAQGWLYSRAVAAQPGGLAAASGARYLQERRMHAAAAQELNRWVAQTLESLLGELRPFAAGFHQRSVSSPAAPGAPQPIVNLAFLVARGGLAAFHHCVERANLEHRDHGLELGLTGPWPPYSFCPTLEMPP